MGEWQQPEARKLLPSVSEAQVESKSHCPHCSQNVEVQPKDEIRTRANGAPKQVFHLTTPKVPALIPLLSPAFSLSYSRMNREWQAHKARPPGKVSKGRNLLSKKE